MSGCSVLFSIHLVWALYFRDTDYTFIYGLRLFSHSVNFYHLSCSDFPVHLFLRIFYAGHYVFTSYLFCFQLLLLNRYLILLCLFPIALKFPLLPFLVFIISLNLFTLIYAHMKVIYGIKYLWEICFHSLGGFSLLWVGTLLLVCSFTVPHDACRLATAYFQLVYTLLGQTFYEFLYTLIQFR